MTRASARAERERRRAVGYVTFLRTMHRRSRPRTYVEIGVFTGMTLSLAGPSTATVGVDPEPRIDRPLGDHVRVFAETSDEFFARPDVAEIVGPVDIAFIDGLHLYEQALRDFINLERRMVSNGVILVHDCRPLDPAIAGRAPEPGVPLWAGDVWKLLPILREYRPDLRVDVIDATPTGLGVITRLDPGNRVLDDRFDEIVDRYRDAPFEVWGDVVPATWRGAGSRFPEFRRVTVAEVFDHNVQRVRYVVRRARRRVS